MSGVGRPEGDARIDGSGLRVGMVATRWHADIVDALLERAVAAAVACGVPAPTVVRVPGAVELSVVAQALAERHDAVVADDPCHRGTPARPQPLRLPSAVPSGRPGRSWPMRSRLVRR